ncbi:MAG: sigma 54-interacting transcriptional regulator, partial [Clostridia bacterium]|nr:sigma 54-interacting transcriptional regulator [Clostridia bacterium]
HLLRVLQERCVTRIGGTRCIATDVRVIAATNKNLTDAIKKGTFREDLYYRLCVFPISIPPLKERKEDIQIIAKNLISKKAKRLNIEPPKMRDEQIQKLMDYSWPGNIRELENKIENYMINGKILLDPENDSVDLSKNKSDEYFKYEMQTLEEWEKIAFNACLKKCNGNVSKTAKILNVDRSTIYKKMLKYDIQMDKPDS